VLHREGLLDQNLKYLTCVQHVGTVLLSAVSEILKYSLLITVGKGTRMSRIDKIRVILVASPVFGCFVGGVGIDKEPSGLAVHLISPRNSSETSDRGALSMP
jgi:hypothetical protein